MKKQKKTVHKKNGVGYFSLLKSWFFSQSPLMKYCVVQVCAIICVTPLLYRVPPHPKIVYTPALPPENQELFTSQVISLEELKEKEQTLTSIVQDYPTHRDILINLAEVKQTLGEEDAASIYRERARYQDPNNPLFE
ncbi:MAG: hypothetical protein H6774_02100 [Pseudomonadales bacterium]|nr:hypothetical protein [Pseudomonadales bacterium]